MRRCDTRSRKDGSGFVGVLIGGVEYVPKVEPEVVVNGVVYSTKAETEEKTAPIVVLSRSGKKAVSSTPNIDLISKANIDVDVINGLAAPRLNHWMSVRNFKSAKVCGASAWRAKLSEWGYVCASDAGSVMITGIKDDFYAQAVASAEECG